MFPKNDLQLQLPLFSSMDSLPEEQLKRLEASSAGAFYREFSVRIDQETFAPLFSDERSRSNLPVKVQFGLEIPGPALAGRMGNGTTALAATCRCATRQAIVI